MRSQIQKLTKAQRKSRVDFANESFSKESLVEILGQRWKRDSDLMDGTRMRSNETGKSGKSQSTIDIIDKIVSSDEKIATGAYDVENKYFRHDTVKFMIEARQIVEKDPDPISPQTIE